VFAPPKRRQLFYYLSLPFVVAIVFFMVARLAALQRAEVVAELAEQVAHHDTPEATAALRRLAAMPRPPVDILVTAATSADAQISHEAQLLVSGVLRRWQRRIEADRGLAGVARELAGLAEALDKHQAAFSVGDHEWLRKTVEKLIRLANQMPPPHSPLLASHCDAVLATVAAREQSVASLVNRDLTDAQPPTITKAAAPMEVISEQPSTPVHSLRKFTPGSASPFASSADATDRNADKSETAAPMKPAPQIHSPVLPGAVNHSNGSPIWQHPGLDGSPAIPIDQPPIDRDDARDEPFPATRYANGTGGELVSRPLEAVTSRELLRRWLDADGSEVLPVESELTRRGFVRLSARLVEPLFSKNAEDRLRLVDDVLTQPGIDARPWLVLLADDQDADVRLLAVTIMATSEDAMLIEKAWHVSIRDRDPRIAGLAGRLRERRSATR
jgi:hypothetical protein